MANLRPFTRQLLLLATRRVSLFTPLSSHSSTRPIPISYRLVSSSESRKDLGPSDKAKANGRRLQLITAAMTALFGASYILYHQLSAKEEAESEKEELKHEKIEEEKKRISFHDRRVIEYENRIRAYSTPDKIFRYFATINMKDMESGVSNIYMTPEDFLRSITPGDIQPSDYGLDKFRNVTLEQWKRKHTTKTVDRDSVFANLGYYGLISFSDYLFLLTILATPARHFEIAFKMFDLNGDGEVDCEEFQTVQGVVLNSTAVGARHRDHGTTGSVAGSVGDALTEHFFGPKKDKRLTIDKFRTFHSRLLNEIMKLEFDKFDQVNGCISELDFAHFVLSYASMNDQRKKKFFKRIKRKYGSEQTNGGSMSFEDVKSFLQLVEVITDVEMALSMYSAAGASITANDLKSVAKAVSGVELNNNLVDFIITLFDEDGDGNLSHKEFIKVMKTRTTRGLEKSKELGFSRFVGSVMACSIKTVKDQLGIKS